MTEQDFCGMREHGRLTKHMEHDVRTKGIS